MASTDFPCVLVRACPNLYALFSTAVVFHKMTEECTRLFIKEVKPCSVRQQRRVANHLPFSQFHKTVSQFWYQWGPPSFSGNGYSTSNGSSVHPCLIVNGSGKLQCLKSACVVQALSFLISPRYRKRDMIPVPAWTQDKFPSNYYLHREGGKERAKNLYKPQLFQLLKNNSLFSLLDFEKLITEIWVCFLSLYSSYTDSLISRLSLRLHSVCRAEGTGQ